MRLGGSIVRIVTVTASLLVAPRAALAEPNDPRTSLDAVDVGLWTVGSTGSRLVGSGSRTFVKRAGVDLELGVRRYVTKRVGFELRIVGMPPYSRDLEDIAHGRFDGAIETPIVAWTGRVPGAVELGVGLGADVGRYSYAGRLYPRGVVRLSLFATRDTTLHLTSEVLPAAVGPDTRVFEQRTDFAFTYGLFMAGFRAAHAVEYGLGTRSALQQELGLFVGAEIPK